jgi:hypothetical protein
LCIGIWRISDVCPSPSKNPKVFEEETLGLDLRAQATQKP